MGKKILRDGRLTSKKTGAVQTSANYAVATFCLVGWANYEYFQYKRRLEKRGMQRVVEVMDWKRGEREREKEKERERGERRRFKEEEDRRMEEEERRREEEERRREGRWWRGWGWGGQGG